MKIIFICGCIEPGKDGVGDYTRRLGCELIRQGISVGVLALHDCFVNTDQKEDQISDHTTISVYRLPHTFSHAKKTFSAKTWVEQNNPDWLSVQFVPYAYNDKGIPFRLANQLKEIGGERKWHIMFHELWLGLRR